MTDGLPAGADQQLARALQTNTNGNPFFVTELLLSLIESGTLTDEQGRWRGIGELEGADRLPASISETLGRRVRRLGGDVGRCLGVAAVIGAEFDLDLVARVCEVVDAAEALDAAVADALLLEVPGRPTHFRFTHALMERYLYGELGPARRADAAPAGRARAREQVRRGAGRRHGARSPLARGGRQRRRERAALLGPGRRRGAREARARDGSALV